MQAIAFDFEHKRSWALAPGEIAPAMAAGAYVWLDLDAPPSAAELAQWGAALPTDLRQDLANPAFVGHYARHPEALHLCLPCCAVSGGEPRPQRLDAVLREQMLLTVHGGPHPVIDAMRVDVETDFAEHARSPSFLLYELFDHALEQAAAAQGALSDEVAALQLELRGTLTEALFRRSGALGGALLDYRRHLLALRAILAELAGRRSRWVSEPTQQALGSMTGRAERLLEEVLADREILAETLSLNMSMIAFRTNQTIRRLTVVSIVFLPLTFLVGVYGMNFEHMPELGWRWGYAAFWLLALAITGGVVALLRRRDLL